MDKLLKQRQDLFKKVKELHQIRSTETGKILRRAHYCKTLEDKEALTPELTTKNLEIANQLETLYTEIIMLDELIINDIRIGKK